MFINVFIVLINMYQSCNLSNLMYIEYKYLMYKIYVEVERARLTHRLAKIKEEEGDIAGAASVMMELQVYAF